MPTTLSSFLTPYQEQVERAIQANTGLLGPPSPVHDACMYTLEGGGKRFRPALVMMVAEALGSTANLDYASLAVEYFHTASLIADDLPCMDNDLIRRDRPSTHIKFGEEVALLATYGLIAAGYDALVKQAEELPNLLPLAIRCASQTTGLYGATGGQYFDLHPKQSSREELEKIIVMKTVTLFELSFVLGWLFGGGDPGKLSTIRLLAYDFGMAFQIADDLDDWDQDDINLAKLMGRDETARVLDKHLNSFFTLSSQVGMDSTPFKKLASTLIKTTCKTV